MKKIIAVAMAISVATMICGPAMAQAVTDPGAVTTGLTRDTSGGQTPIVKAKWEAYGESVPAESVTVATPLDYYHDALVTKGAQINPTGVYNDSRTIAICAVVTDPDGLADITTAPGAVFGDVFYPEDIALGDSHKPLKDQTGDGCGKFMQEDKLTKLSKADGLELFCTNVRNNNNNLPTFGVKLPDTTPVLYDYDEICALDGELQKETAGVWCTTKDLSYEDPSGNYEVWAVAQDKVGLQGKLVNEFTYRDLTAFETDFTNITYGSVRLATHKIISGDLTWGNSIASVRNVGNTRLAMRVWQDDMGFGKTDGNWNVKFDARVGSSASWANYYPEVTKTLANELDLSELDEMDFSIDVTKFPPQHEGDDYSGDMTLSAMRVAHLIDCPAED